MTERPSGDPAWEGPKSRGLPRTAAHEAAPPPAGSDPAHRAGPKPVARWLGWSPTSWRTSR